MQNITVKDKDFSLFIPEQRINQAIQDLAKKINADLNNQFPLFVGVLNGSFMFVGELLKNIQMPCEVSFIKVASYSGTASEGEVKKLIGFNEKIKGRTVVICEDIVDTGLTMEAVMQELSQFQPAEIKLATLLFKPTAFQKNYQIDYVALEIPDDFVLGYGLDYDGLGRNYRDIYKVLND